MNNAENIASSYLAMVAISSDKLPQYLINILSQCMGGSNKATG